MNTFFEKQLNRVFACSLPSCVWLFVAILAVSLMAGCAVGPIFHRPPPPAVSDYTEPPLTNTVATTNSLGGEAQHFSKAGDLAGDWWMLFHSAPLNELIELALTNNPDLKAAQAALTVARENVLAQRGVFYPSVAASFSASRQKQSELISPTPNASIFQYNLFTPQVSVSYSPDVFGLNRRTVESVKAQEQNVRFQMIAAYTTLTANVVVTAIQLAAVQAQIDATRQLVDLNSNMVEILRYQYTKGYAGRLSSHRNRSSRRSTPRCRRCSNKRRNSAICWRCWRDDFPTSRRWKNLSCRVCNCRWKFP